MNWGSIISTVAQAAWNNRATIVSVIRNGADLAHELAPVAVSLSKKYASPQIAATIAKYAPAVVTAAQNAPAAIAAINSVTPQIDAMVKSGVAPAEAMKKVAVSRAMSLIGPHAMTATDEARFADRGSGSSGG